MVILNQTLTKTQILKNAKQWNGGMLSMCLDFAEDITYSDLNRMKKVKSPKIGDIVMYDYKNRDRDPWHAAVYIGKGKVIHYQMNGNKYKVQTTSLKNAGASYGLIEYFRKK